MFRFYKRIKIFPGLTLNVSKKSVSVSAGVRGAKITFGKNIKTTIGIPGTGLFFTENIGRK